MPPTDEALVAAAAANNATWCHAVCRTHGLAPAAAADAWTSAARTPPLYPDAVTLEREVSIPDLLERIDASAGCSIKDSFASLDLEPHGFSVLFDAQWIARPPRPGSPAGGAESGSSVVEGGFASLDLGPHGFSELVDARRAARPRGRARRAAMRSRAGRSSRTPTRSASGSEPGAAPTTPPTCCVRRCSTRTRCTSWPSATTTIGS